MRFILFSSLLFITTIFFTSLSLSSSQPLKTTPPPSPSPSPSPPSPPLPPPPPEPTPVPAPAPALAPAPEPSPPPPPPSFPKPSIELTPPLATANLPLPPPECTLNLFATNSAQPPFTTVYSPPENCSSPWSHAVLQFSGKISGQQSYLIAGIWISGVEILRTSTPQSSDINGTFWNVTKDITRYNSLLQMSNISVYMMFDNLVNDQFTGNCDFNASILFYKEAEIKKLGGRKLGLGFGDLRGEIGVYDEPADLVIPVAKEGYSGHWFKIESESQVGLRRVEFPANTRRVVLELYASSHGDDELWYANPPNEYIEMNNLSLRSGNGASRQILVKIDGELVGYEVPFPVIYTGGINPFSWDSIVGIGAFDLPSYDFELTPFLGSLLDGKNHNVEIRVSNAISFWLVDANLHIWLDQNSSKVDAGVIVGKASEFEESQECEFKRLDGEFELEVERKSESSGWVADSSGNFTTTVSRKLKFKNKIKYQQDGTQKVVEQKVKVKTEVKVVSNTNSVVSSRSSEREYPLNIVTSIVSGQEDEDSITTEIKQEMKEKSAVGNSQTTLQNTQDSKGSLVVKDGSILSGDAQTHQSLSYQGPSSCVQRTANAAGGEILMDSTAVCSSHLLSSW